MSTTNGQTGSRTVIVHYGAGNIRSVARGLERLGEPSVISSDPEVIRSATRLILPGVGSFDQAMNTLRKNNVDQVLKERVVDQGTPILGICLGLQLFTERSEEGTAAGLGWIRGETKLFAPQHEGRKVPHVGWNTIHYTPASQLFDGFPSNPSMYFVHSYYVTGTDEEVVSGRTTYGETFVSAVQTGNIFGVQFHPEKSQQIGLLMLANFLKATS